MASAKDIVLRPIDASTANALCRRLHYSGKVVPNSQLHLGVYLGGRVEGVMQLGPAMDKRKALTLVRDTEWNGFLELNRMAFSDQLPRNSESRALGVMRRVLRKHAPHVEWVLSYADGTQCGDGTIYRAAGFLLTGIKKSTALFRLPSGETIHQLTLTAHPDTPRPELGGRTLAAITKGGASVAGAYVAETGATRIPGFQLRYILPLAPGVRERLTVPVLPYSAIEEAGAGMYLGQPRAGSTAVVRPATSREGGGSNPTPAL